MSTINKTRFEILEKVLELNCNGRFILYDKYGHHVEAIIDTEYESDNDLEMDDPNYEEFRCIVFERTSDGTLFEVNYHLIPVKAICDDVVLYDEYHYPDINIIEKFKNKI